MQVDLPPGLEIAVTPYPPTPLQSLIFYCKDPISMGRNDSDRFLKQSRAVLVGPQYSRVNICVHRRLSAIRVDFFPGAVFRLLGIPMYELFDEGYDAELLFGPPMRELCDQLQESDDLAVGSRLVERFLLHAASNGRPALPFDHAVRELLFSDELPGIEASAALACLSLKQFERRAKERLGMNPKSFHRILRFSRAYRLHESRPELNWTRIAHQSGYYDQMHMIRDFREFAGVNPTVIESQLSHTPLRMQRDLLI